MARRQNMAGLIAQIGREQGLTNAQIRAMIATAKQESGLNPRSVGDGGTSFGLFQHHIGGAGGSTEASARRYLDPVTSITERAKWFKKNNIRGGEGAAALQRPADPSGYAASVNAILGGVKVPAGTGMPSEAPVSRSPGTESVVGTNTPDGVSQWADSYLANYLYKDDPVMAGLFASTVLADKAQPQQTQQTTQSIGPQPNEPDGSGPTPAGRLKNWKDLQKLARQFGLENDPGNYQTTGGNHEAGSLHYSGRAVDFGDARNSPDRLKKFSKYLSRHAGMLGINEIAYNPMGWGVDQGHRIPGMTWEGHDDHLHVGLYGE